MANSKQKKSWKLSKKNNNMAYGLGAAIVIVGALMKITHFSYGPLTGNLMLTIGLVTEALIFTLSAFDADLAKEDVDYKWEKIYPELLDGATGTGKTVTSPAGELQKKLDAMLKEAKVDVSLFESLTSSIKDMEASAKSGASTADGLAKINKEFAENANNLQKQMGALASNLESLNNVYGGVLSAMNKK
jgi:gliding motility-associated protein GldL